MTESKEIDYYCLRAKKARLSNVLNLRLANFLFLLSILTIIGGVFIIIYYHLSYGYLLISFGLLSFVLGAWAKWDLNVLPVDSKTLSGRLSRDILANLKKTDNSPKKIFSSLETNWQSYFLTNHLYLPAKLIQSLLSDNPQDLQSALNKASLAASSNPNQQIEVGDLVVGIFLTSQPLINTLTRAKLNTKDVEEINEWLKRILLMANNKKQNFGGVGRDWSFGFTNFLNHFAYNISQEIIDHGSNFGWLTTSKEVLGIEAALANGANAIAIIGPPGIGKTSRVYALAQRLIEGKENNKVAYHQIMQLDASTTLANAKSPGALENIFNRLTSEASRAGHVILFLDDAELFFNQGPGSINAAAILQPIIQSRAVQFIMAFTPENYQHIRSNNTSLANLITPVLLSELNESEVMNILEDSATGIEHSNQCLITYDALKTAYRLSGRYNDQEAYPGKAIKLLNQSIAFSKDKVIDSLSVESAIEQSTGVKVSSAEPAEASSLLHLEEQIHQRMINQSEAVKAVSASLRRARAGIANPKRPIGSFLFLGPTGVGKTELAKAVASTYFGSIDSIIRLDMSEYQQVKDIDRLLSTGNDTNKSLLMSVRQQPFSVILFDEVEKANPNILNLLLQLLDEGQLTDASGRSASFKDSIIIATSNAGADAIRNQITQGKQLVDFKEQLTNQLIEQNIFKSELLNRFDDIVLFRPLNQDELAQVVRLLIIEINSNLEHQNITISLSDQAIAKIVQLGSDQRYGARPMRRALQKGVEDNIAKRILTGEAQPGSQILLDEQDIDL